MSKFRKFLIPGVTGILVVLIFVVFPKVFKNPDDLQKYLFYSTRLILMLYIYMSLYFYFIEGLNFKAEYQKLFFRGAILSLVFTAFTSAGLFINYFQDAQYNVANFSIIKSWFLQASKFLKAGMIYTIVTIIILYFHPQNQLKRTKSKS